MKWMLRLFGVAFVCATVLVLHTLFARPLSIDWFFERDVARGLLHDPELATMIGVLDATPFDFYNDDLNDASLSAMDARYARAREALDVLSEYDRDALSPEQRTSYDFYAWLLETTIADERFKLHHYAITQWSGAYLGLVQLLSDFHRLANRGDVDDWLARLGKVETKLDQQLEVSRAQTDLGIVPPRFIVEKTLSNLRNIRDAPASASPYVAPFRLRLADVAGLDDAERSAIVDQAITLVRESVHPAYDRTIEHVESLLERATDAAGVWALPDGEAYYRHQIRRMTTTDLSPDEIHEIGLAEVDRIESEMTAILEAEGVTGAPLPELLNRLLRDERFLLPDTAESRAQRVREYTAIVEEIGAGIASAFHTVPRASIEVRRIPEYREASAASHYNPPSLDGSRPAVFYAKLETVPARWTMRTLAYHEAIPGHHLQIARAIERTDLPSFRRGMIVLSSFSEGWALYAERLAAELGYLDDPFDDLGRLRDENWRAVRLVVDTGLHHKRWTRQQALDYMEAHLGAPEPSEIDRYCVWPGQALAYKIGMMEFLSLRERARTALGERFTLADYHELAIAQGALPFPVLERLVDEWIAAGS